MNKDRVDTLPAQYLPALDALPSDMHLIASAVEDAFPGMGVPVVMVLAQRFGGGPVYIQKLKGSFLAWRDDQIRAMYDEGTITARELAWYWRLSQSSVEKILSRESTSQKELREKQLNLFQSCGKGNLPDQ